MPGEINELDVFIPYSLFIYMQLYLPREWNPDFNYLARSLPTPFALSPHAIMPDAQFIDNREKNKPARRWDRSFRKDKDTGSLSVLACYEFHCHEW